MRKSSYTGERIIGPIQQAEAGVPIKELCRKGGFSDATFYKWRTKYSGMDVPDARRLREIEAENGKLKKLLAEAHLDIHASTLQRPYDARKCLTIELANAREWKLLDEMPLLRALVGG